MPIAAAAQPPVTGVGDDLATSQQASAVLLQKQAAIVERIEEHKRTVVAEEIAQAARTAEAIAAANLNVAAAELAQAKRTAEANQIHGELLAAQAEITRSGNT